MLQGVYLTLCNDQKEFDAVLRQLDMPSERWLEDNHNACVHTYRHGTKVTCVVCIPLISNTPIEIARLIVHEATHVKQQLMAAIGEDSPSKEFEAYTMQNISVRLLDEYANRLKKLKPA